MRAHHFNITWSISLLKFHLPTILFVSILIFFSNCSKKDVEENVPNNSSLNLNSKIELLARNYQNHGNHVIERKWDPRKALLLGIADGVGAGLGSSTPLGLYGVLWGGLLASIGVEPYIRGLTVAPPDTLILPASPGSGYFLYGNIGDAHNILIKNAFARDLEISVTNGVINSETETFFYDYKLFGGTNGQVEAAYDSSYSTLVSIISYTQSVDSSTFSLSGLLNVMPLDSIVESTIETIAAQLLLMEDIEEAHLFLIDVEDVVANDSMLTVAQKEAIRKFNAVTNSSIQLWHENDY